MLPTRRLGTPLLVAVFLVLPCAVETAQGQVRIVPQAGLYMPVTDFGEITDPVDGSTGGPVEFGRKSSTLALGLGADVTLPATAFGARGTVAYGTSSPVPVISDGLERSTRSTLLVATAGLMIRPLPRLLVARPYLLAGGGVKRFDFDRSRLREEGFEGVLRNQTRGTVHLGLGVDVRMGGLLGVVELSNFIGSFEPGGGATDGVSLPTGEGRFMHDLFLTVGIALGG